MIKFEHTTVNGFETAIRGMRNSWGSHGRSDSTNEVIGESDYKLMMNLVKGGPSHAKYLRQINVGVDITSHLKWWDEADTYKIGTTANSTSMMHTLGRSELVKSDLSFEDIDPDIEERSLEIYKLARQRWIDSGKKKPSREWRQMVLVTPVAFNYTRTWTANYQVLRTIYHDRKNHRLSEWHEMCEWIESLPYSELITVSKK